MRSRAAYYSSAPLFGSSVIPYVTDEKADAATKNPQLKLLFRLCKFYILDEGEEIEGGCGVELMLRTCRCR